MTSIEDNNPPSAEEHAVALLKTATINDENFKTALGILDQSIHQGSAIAAHIKGDVHLQHPSLQDASRIAVESYRMAAKSGLQDSIERLADCYLTGFGVTQDDNKALQLTAQLADKLHPDGMINQAYMLSAGLGCEPNLIASGNLLLQAAAIGNTLAFRLLAERYWHGYGVPKNIKLAYAWLELSRLRKFPDANWRQNQIKQTLNSKLSEDARVIIDHGLQLADQIKQALQVLPAKMDKLHETCAPNQDDYVIQLKALVTDNLASTNIQDIHIDPHIRLANKADTNQDLPNIKPQLQLRAQSPRVLTAENFISDEENILLLACSAPLMVLTSEIKESKHHLEIDAFDGACAMMASNRTPPVVRQVIRRFSSIVDLPCTHFEPASVLCYQSGDEYSLHVDYFDADRIKRHQQIGDYGGQRMITALIYLMPPQLGGETDYPVANLSVKGQRNQCTIHYNADQQGQPDLNSSHASKPVLEGEKWLFRTSARQFSLYRTASDQD